MRLCRSNFDFLCLWSYHIGRRFKINVAMAMHIAVQIQRSTNTQMNTSKACRTTNRYNFLPVNVFNMFREGSNKQLLSAVEVMRAVRRRRSHSL